MSMSQGEQQRGWFARHWFWFIPMVIGVPILGCCGCFGGLFYIGLNAIKSSTPYTEALKRAQESSAVQAALGTPIEAGFLPSGSINTRTVNGVQTGNADLTISISGPNGSGILRVVGVNSGGIWNYSVMQVILNNPPRIIDLLAGGP
jgi:hypothetical protein